MIVAVDGHQIVNESDLPRLITHYNPGDTVHVQIIRDGQDARTVDVKLGERPETGG